MSKSAGVLLELLEEPMSGDADMSAHAHLLGQVAAEVITSDPSPETLQKLTTTAQMRQLMTTDASSQPHDQQLRLANSLLVGLFQTLLVYKDSPDRPSKGQGTVKERILFVLAEGAAPPSDVAEKAGCAPAVASRALRMLREEKLAERITTDSADDRRFHLHRLTPAGEAFVDSRFLGDTSRLVDQLEGPSSLTETVGHTTQLINLTVIRATRRIASTIRQWRQARRRPLTSSQRR